MKTITSTIAGLTLAVAVAGLSFAGQAPAKSGTSATPAATTAKKHVKKHGVKPAAKSAATSATPAAK